MEPKNEVMNRFVQVSNLPESEDVKNSKRQQFLLDTMLDIRDLLVKLTQEEDDWSSRQIAEEDWEMNGQEINFFKSPRR